MSTIIAATLELRKKLFYYGLNVCVPTPEFIVESLTTQCDGIGDVSLDQVMRVGPS